MLKNTINLLFNRNIVTVQKTWFCSVLSENTISLKQNNFNKQKEKLQEIETQQLFLKDDPNMFGNLIRSKSSTNENQFQDEGDIKEEEFLSNPPSTKKLSTKQYADLIKAHIRKRQIKEAIDLLEIRIIKEDKVKPENYLFNLVIGACGRVGYTKKAFKLFNDMKKRDLQPTNGTYTALFNACANSPWLEDGLSRATKLRELMKEKGVIANDTNYNSMIKAFGRCGDIVTAFSLVDEMIENKFPIKEDTINFLLQSCISNKELGFRHALLVWRKFHQRRINPNLFSFNLMLRCIRDCSIGDAESMNNLLQSPDFKLLENKESVKQIEFPKESISETAVELYNCPNLMASAPHLGNIVKLSEITKSEDRLMLIGGLNGFLKNMEEFKITPDIKTFTLLLDCIPSTVAAEKMLISAMKKAKVRYDVDFLNMLIKKRVMRFDYENAKDVVVSLFKPPKLRPNLITYGVLALSCETKEQSDAIIQEMKDAGYRMNIQILGAMLKTACIKMKFSYILELMELTIKEKIKPNKIFIQHLEDLYKKAKKESETRKDSNFVKGFRLFRMRYKTWSEEIELDKSEETHPWEQFRKPTDTNIKNYKDPVTHFKPQVKSKFREKTGRRN